MIKNKSKLEYSFNEFIYSNIEAFENGCVDYLGINIAASYGQRSIFKIYYNDKASRYNSHPLIDFLKDNEMVRYLTVVDDKDNKNNYDRLRIDIGLKNRTNKNMINVFEWLKDYTKIFEINAEKIKKISEMKVTELDGYNYAGLYFLGFVSKNEEISTLKCHYFNRICEDPDILHENIQFADKYYLKFISNVGISEFIELAQLSGEALKVCGGHLWMVGTDYAISSPSKYKIYIKNPSYTYEGLIKIFSSTKYKYLQQQIFSVKNWNDNHKKFNCEGFAICMDSNKKLSINFYFIM